jgi:hypothetical protein
MRQTSRAARFPVAEHPVRRFKHIRWQVSRLAEQDFSSDPRLPDPDGVSGISRISPVTVAGAAASGSKSLNPIAFPLRLS